MIDISSSYFLLLPDSYSLFRSLFRSLCVNACECIVFMFFSLNHQHATSEAVEMVNTPKVYTQHTPTCECRESEAHRKRERKRKRDEERLNDTIKR